MSGVGGVSGVGVSGGTRGVRGTRDVRVYAGGTGELGSVPVSGHPGSFLVAMVVVSVAMVVVSVAMVIVSVAMVVVSLVVVLTSLPQIIIITLPRNPNQNGVPRNDRKVMLSKDTVRLKEICARFVF